jgi:hypothetical protein
MDKLVVSRVRRDGVNLQEVSLLTRKRMKTARGFGQADKTSATSAGKASTGNE